MYTLITARCIDQTLQITHIPKIASGGENEIRIDVSFDAMWDGLGKTAIFYRNENQVYHVVMVNDSCVIPREVLAEPGHLHFGIIGVDGSSVRTTEVVVMEVAQGSITGLSPLEPLPDVYKQVLSAYGSLANEIAAERSRIDNLTTLDEGSTTGDAELADIRVGYDGTTYGNAGTAVRTQMRRMSSAYAEVFCNVINEDDADVKTGGYYEKSASTSFTEHPDCAGVRWIASADFNQSGLIPTRAGDRLFNSTRQPNNENAWGVPCLYYDASKKLIYMRTSNNALYKCEADGCTLVSSDAAAIYKETPPYSDIAYLSVPYAVSTPSYTFANSNGQIGRMLPYGVRVVTAEILASNQWADKTWYAYGTSLTSTAQGKYVPTVAETLGMTYINKGIPGGGLVANTQVYDALMSLTDGKTEADLITIEVGANDGSAPLGEPTSLDTGTVCGALNTCLRTILKNCNAQVVVMCSTPSRYSVDDQTAYEIGTEYSGGYTVLERNLAIEQCAKANGVYFTPLAQGMGVYRQQSKNAEYLVDNIHMSDVGGYNAAMALISYLKTVPNWYASVPVR